MDNIELSAFTVTLIVSVLIPIVTGIITKITTSSAVKAVITLILNAVNALVVGNVMDDGRAVFSEETLVTFIISLAISVAIYVGVYKPMTVTSSTEDGKLLPHRGLL